MTIPQFLRTSHKNVSIMAHIPQKKLYNPVHKWDTSHIQTSPQKRFAKNRFNGFEPGFIELKTQRKKETLLKIE